MSNEPNPRRGRLDVLSAQIFQAAGGYDPLDPFHEDDAIECPTCRNDGWDEHPDGLSTGPDGNACRHCGGTGMVRPSRLVPDSLEVTKLRTEWMWLDAADREAMERGLAAIVG
jgi:DNA-directed RNA polymerase subunit RPC12/RpoP